MRRLLFLVTCLLLAPPAMAESWDEVNAVFQGRCIACHSGDAAPLGLHLDSYKAAMKGSENGPVIRPGDPEQSPLMHRLLGKAEPRMPLDGPPFLEDEVIAKISKWIKSGAKGPSESAAAEQAPPAAPADPRADGRILYSEVSSIFGKHCVKCHSDNSKMGAPPEGLRLGSYADILNGSERVVLIPRNAQASEIIRRVEGLASPRMPFDGPPWLTAEEIALLRDWIDGGALDNDGNAAPIPAGRIVRMRGLLTADSEVDGAAFTHPPGMRVKGAPRIGQPVELRGRIAADGAIAGERLSGRD
ncbi:c-type cytochrome domain-containing protein [Aestuariivirga sp.]|uniref:c-type cytochrome domain-containing protein n=1 Tax=Aestuariivirga sp. TaxID=2650926 RepID=UPI003BABD6A4